MATKTVTSKPKQVPAFYLFDTIEQDGKKELKRIGAAFAHKTGSGFNFIINGKRYVAFPTKSRTAAAGTEGAA